MVLVVSEFAWAGIVRQRQYPCPHRSPHAFLRGAPKCWCRQQQAKVLDRGALLQCNEGLFHFFKG